ncbi:MAG: shikimate dehydrogenase [Burkholderiales bacterium]
MTDHYAVIGNPVAHSKSPFIHAEFARQTGEDLSYDALYSELTGFEAAVMRFREGGGRGLNVTVPFKHRAYALAEHLTARAKSALAVNTLTFSEDSVSGDNTDGAGLIRDLTANLRVTLLAKRILLMGAGGASYGVCGPLLDQRPAVLVVANRSLDKAVALCQRFDAVHTQDTDMRAAAYGDLAGEQFDLIINATSAGLANAMPALPAGVFAPGALAYEMVYDKATPFMQFAQREGAHTADGLGMLVEQAAESFYVWRGVRPRTASVIQLLRASGE